jgi:hypothetical protein
MLISTFSRQPIVSSAKKFEISFVAQDLQLLAYFLLDVPIQGKNMPEFIFESIHFLYRKSRTPYPLNTLHHLQNPSPGARVLLIAKKYYPSPFIDHAVLLLYNAISDQEYPASERNLLQQDVAPNPPSTTS